MTSSNPIGISTRTIGNHTYQVRKLGASEGRKMLIRLTKILGPALAALLEDPSLGKGGNPAAKVAKKGWSILDLDTASLGRALRTLAERLGEEDLEYFVRTLGPTTQVEFPDGKVRPLTLEEQELHWAGNYSSMFKWVAFCLEVNFSDFFGGSKAIRAALEPLARAAEKAREDVEGEEKVS